MDITKNDLWCSRGHFNKDQADFISSLVKKHNPIYVLETGFCTGRSAISVLLSSDKIEKFVSIDINYDYIKPEGRVMRQRISDSFSNFVSYEKDTNIFLNNKNLADEFPNGIDWFTVDGDHSYKGCLHDLETCLPHINKGGIIIIDDYKSGPPNGCVIKEVTNACNDFYNRNRDKLKKSEWNAKGKGFCIFEII